jgi:hypothetical protein
VAYWAQSNLYKCLISLVNARSRSDTPTSSASHCHGGVILTQVYIPFRARQEPLYHPALPDTPYFPLFTPSSHPSIYILHPRYLPISITSIQRPSLRLMEQLLLDLLLLNNLDMAMRNLATMATAFNPFDPFIPIFLFIYTQARHLDRWAGYIPSTPRRST